MCLYPYFEGLNYKYIEVVVDMYIYLYGVILVQEMKERKEEKKKKKEKRI